MFKLNERVALRANMGRVPVHSKGFIKKIHSDISFPFEVRFDEFDEQQCFLGPELYSLEVSPEFVVRHVTSTDNVDNAIKMAEELAALTGLEFQVERRI